MRAELHRFCLSRLHVTAGFGARFDQIDRAFRTDRGDHLHVEVDLDAPGGAALRVVLLLALFVVLMELGGAETEVLAVDVEVARDVGIVVRIDDGYDLPRAFSSRRKIVSRLKIRGRPAADATRVMRRRILDERQALRVAGKRCVARRACKVLCPPFRHPVRGRVGQRRTGRTGNVGRAAGAAGRYGERRKQRHERLESSVHFNSYTKAWEPKVLRQHHALPCHCEGFPFLMEASSLKSFFSLSLRFCGSCPIRRTYWSPCAPPLTCGIPLAAQAAASDCSACPPESSSRLGR